MQYSPRIAFGRWGENPSLDAMRLRGLLNHFVELNIQILRANAHLPGVYEAGITGSVRYWFNPRDESTIEQFGDLLSVLEERHGACGKLAPYRVAELRERHGIAAECEWESHDIGGREEIHILVRAPGRPPEDPSRALGMRG